MKNAGDHTVEWDGKNSAGRQVGSGVYFYKLNAGNYSETKKMILLR
ncbi:MAG: T9SS type A sorting domain-containing protein [Bacteroidetes bacterium]|nr:T9SS type A sorting domain-containing protein [Bacteroidota bacterium]